MKSNAKARPARIPSERDERHDSRGTRQALRRLVLCRSRPAICASLYWFFRVVPHS